MTELGNILKNYSASLTHEDPYVILNKAIGHQSKKSALMRLSILNAAVKCLVDLGYKNTSTLIVAKTANVSRGALQHHFSTIDKLIEAVIDFLLIQRTKEYVEEVHKLSKSERTKKGTPLEFYWRMGQTKEAFALLELTFAARTNSKLDKILTPKLKAQRELMIKLIPDIFPEWRDVSKEDLRTAQDLVHVLTIGMTIEKDVIGSKARRTRLRKFVFDALQKLR